MLKAAFLIFFPPLKKTSLKSSFLKMYLAWSDSHQELKIAAVLSSPLPHCPVVCSAGFSHALPMIPSCLLLVSEDGNMLVFLGHFFHWVVLPQTQFFLDSVGVIP